MAKSAYVDLDTVRALLAEQFPQWSDLELRAVASAGTDNAIFRLGDDKAVRLPYAERASAQVEKEHRWLPLLARRLPLAIPKPLALGRPGAGFPWHWAVHCWLDGQDASASPIGDLRAAARTLAAFVAALQRIDSTGGPAAGAHNFYRGVPLAQRDRFVRDALARLGDSIDVAAALDAWETALRAPPGRAAPVWIHGDIDARNLLVTDGRICAVIDFGGLAVADPACDLIVAWNCLDATSRDVFRTTLDADPATWARGRGWALSIALIQLPYYLHSNPTLAGIARRTIDAVLDDDR
jgi:aminoglycoside phosphotransferase (APT) family kinase protein